MTFLYPAFGWGFLSLGIILFLYLLKRRYEERPVPSTFLWQQAQRDMVASHPFQRLKRHVLLPLHLLMAAVAVLALMQPVLPNGMAGEMVMIFDLSASMQATDGQHTRLEEAVDAAQSMLAGMNDGDALTILAADDETRQFLSRSTDREAARRALRSLKPSNTGADLNAAVSLAQAMQRETEGLQIVVFSDDYVPPTGVAVKNAAQGLDNRAILSFTVENGQGYARVANYGGEAEVTLACYAGKSLCDAKKLRLPAGGTAGATFTVPECAYAQVVLQEQDGIAADNRLAFVPRGQTNCTVALCGQHSVFLEYALALREDVRLVKTESTNLAADLYVFQDGALFFSVTPSHEAISVGESFVPQGSMGLEGSSRLTQGLSLQDVAARSCTVLSGGRPLISADGQCIAAEAEGVVALGFSLNDTNLPMKYDFPILVQNILTLLLPEETEPASDVSTQRAIPLAESDVRQVAPSTEVQGSGAATAGGLHLAPWLLGLFLVLLVVEWGVYRRGY